MNQENFEKVNLEYGFNAAKDFFLHWSLLAGGTLTLMVPFVESLHTKVADGYLFILSGICLLIALISSSLIVYMGAYISWNNATKVISKKILKFQQFSNPIAIISYVIGIILAFIFISINIL